MFYCEIDKNGVCFHVTENKLSTSNRIIISTSNEIGKQYVNGEWIDVETKSLSVPTLTEQEEISIDTALNVEYMVCLMEESLGLE